MFETKISTFKKYYSDPVDIPLSQWIQSTMNPDSKYTKQVLEYREKLNDLVDEGYTVKDAKDKLRDVKKGFPLATISAICEGGRKEKHIVNRTGWISLDIDLKDNKHLPNVETVRDAVANIIYVAFAGISVSERGVWALVKVSDPQKQERHFKRLQKDFLSKGIILDSTKGENANDARFYSFDPNAYVADDFKIYDRLPKHKPQPKPKPYKPTYTGNNTRDKVEKCISNMHCDITAGYYNWLNICFALVDEFGEAGRDYFHAVSRYYPEYNKRETDRQFDNCLKSNSSGVSIDTFFYHCKQKGVTFKSQSNPAESKSKPVPKNVDPKTGEVLYPAAWDEVSIEPGTQQYRECSMLAIRDADSTERQQLTQ